MAVVSESMTQTLLVSTFFIQNTLFGIDAMKVQEVVRIGDVTRVHHAPDQVIGIINLRGRIVTIIDLAQRLDLPRKAIRDQCRVYIVEWQGEHVGLLVDSVADVITLEPGQVEPLPSNVRGAQGRFFAGVYHEDELLVTILDIDRVLAEDSVKSAEAAN